MRHFCCAEHCHAHATPFPISHHHALLSSTTQCPQQLPLRRDWASATHCPPRQASLSPQDKHLANFVGRFRAPTSCPLPTQLPTVPLPCCTSRQMLPSIRFLFFPAPHHAQCRRAEDSRLSQHPPLQPDNQLLRPASCRRLPSGFGPRARRSPGIQGRARRSFDPRPWFDTCLDARAVDHAFCRWICEIKRCRASPCRTLARVRGISTLSFQW